MLFLEFRYFSLLKLPGEPREHHLDEVRQGMSRSKFKWTSFLYLLTKSLDFLTVDVEYSNKN